MNINYVDSRSPEERAAENKIEVTSTYAVSKQHTPRAGKLIMMKGLPRSGKSTYAKNFVNESGNAIIVSRDELRKMLHNNKWSPRNEQKTVSAQMSIVRDALSKGTTVLIDDTNLLKSHYDRWNNVAIEMNSNFEVKHIKETNLYELVKRDNDAIEKRGSDVIVKLALESKNVNFSKDSVVICDLDGTLCNIEHRRHFVRDGNKDWKSFFDYMHEDLLIESTFVELLKHLANEKHIIFVSARPEKYRKVTTDWLREHGFELEYNRPKLLVNDQTFDYNTYNALLMRPDNDSRDDTIIKQEILDRYLNKDWIHCVYDDRPKVIRMWQSNGLNVIDCGNGIEF